MSPADPHGLRAVLLVSAADRSGATCGADIRFHRLREALQSFGDSLVVLSASYNGAAAPGDVPSDEIVEGPVEIRTVHTPVPARRGLIRIVDVLWTLVTTRFLSDSIVIPRLRRALVSLLDERDFDYVVFSYYIDAGLIADIRKRAPQARVIIDTCDVQQDRYEKLFALLAPWRRLLNVRFLAGVRRRETAALRLADVLIAGSDGDVDRLREIAPNVDVVLGRTGAGASTYPVCDAPDMFRVQFFGAMDGQANLESARWLATKVLPMIRSRDERFVLEICGSNPRPEVVALEQLPGVTVSGFVPDLEERVRCGLCLAVWFPISYGHRVRFYEALGFGLPVVTNRLAAEGMDLGECPAVMYAETAEEFAEVLATLAVDPARRKELGRLGRAWVLDQILDTSSIRGCLAAIQEN